MKTALYLIVITVLLAASNLSATTLYVSPASVNPTPPYATWATAATNIQDAVNAAGAGDTLLVTNGVYAGGVTVTKRLTALSVNGPQFTAITGGGPCVALSDGASLTGFTLTNGNHGVLCSSTNAFLTNCVITCNLAGDGGGASGGTLYNCTLTSNNAGRAGGGASGSTLYNCTLNGNWAEVFDFDGGFGGGAAYSTLYNCTLVGNSAIGDNSGLGLGGFASGGGAYGGTLYNCILVGNSASDNSAPVASGGGAYGGTLYNCTLTANSAGPNGYGGGASYSTLNNCIAYFNTAQTDSDWHGSTLNYCCTTPLPTNGVGNITLPPLFVDYPNRNLRLQSNSPCINAGNNAYVTNSTDLDGRPRIVSGTVDMGAYEFQPGVNGAFIGWLQQYGLPTDGSTDYTDRDQDGMNNWQEWVCRTNPINALSAFPAGTNVTVSWQSVAGVNYFLERGANLASAFTPLATNIVGQAGTTSYADTNAAGLGPFLYRVGVKCP